MKLTLEVYSTSAGDTGGAPSFGVRIRDRRALEAGALYDPLDVNFLVDKEFLPAPETVAVSIYRPAEDGEDALVATTAGSAFAPVPGHSMMRRGALATATQGFDSWYEETRCPDGDHTYPVPVFSILEVRWSCGADDCMARAGAVPAILTPIGVRAVKGLDGEDGEDGKAPEVDVADLGDGTYRMTVTSPDGTVQTAEWRDGRDGDGIDFPAPVSPADATKDDQYADALAVQGLLDSLRKDLSGVKDRLGVIDGLIGIESLDEIQSSLAAKVDKVDGSGLVPVGHISVLADFIDRHGNFGKLASLDEVPFECLAASFTERFEALEATVESLSSSGGETLTADYVKFLDAVVAFGDDSAQRILDAVDLVLAESNDAGKGIWKAVNANAKGLAELEAKVGSGGSSSISAELEAMIRNSVQKDAFGRGFSSNDFTQDYIDRINNSVQKEAGKGLSTVDFTMERAERLDALYNSSSTLNPPVKPDENAKEGQPADAKDTYEALKGLSFTKAPDSHGSDWGDFSIASTNSSGSWSFVTTPPIEWREPPVSSLRGWYLCPFEFELQNEVPAPGAVVGSLAKGRYKFDGRVWISDDKNLTSGNASFTIRISLIGTTSSTVNINFIVRFSRKLYVYKDDSYVTKTYVDSKITDEIGKIEIPEPDIDVVLPSDLDCATLLAADSVTVGFRNPAVIPGQASFSSGRGNIASGDHSHAEGDSVIANGLNSHAEGCTTKAEGYCSHAEGEYTEASGAYSHAAGFRAKAQQHAYAWSGVESDTVYESNGDGTYNINPANGIEGFYIGQKNLKTILSDKRDKTDNIAAADEFTEWECFPSEREGEKISIVKLTDEFGKPFYLPKIGESLQDGQSLNDPMTEYTWKAHENWICDFDLTARRKVATKSGEPYVTPTGVKALTGGKQDALTPSQQAAVDSGITEEILSRIVESERAAVPNTKLRYGFESCGVGDGEQIAILDRRYNNIVLAEGTASFTLAHVDYVGDSEGSVGVRDCAMVIEVAKDEPPPSITWPANFHPRTDAETDFKCEAAKRNVYWITEYAPNEFCVACWQETEGGNAQ